MLVTYPTIHYHSTPAPSITTFHRMMGTLSSVFGLSCTPGCIFLWSWQPRPILLTIIALTHTHTHLNVHIYASILHILASIITSYFLAVIPTNRNSIWHIFWSFYLAFIGILSDTYADTLSDIYIVTCALWHFIWHKFWHSIWHFILTFLWHSIWHLFWHSICPHCRGARHDLR